MLSFPCVLGVVLLLCVVQGQADEAVQDCFQSANYPKPSDKDENFTIPANFTSTNGIYFQFEENFAFGPEDYLVIHEGNTTSGAVVFNFTGTMDFNEPYLVVVFTTSATVVYHSGSVSPGYFKLCYSEVCEQEVTSLVYPRIRSPTFLKTAGKSMTCNYTVTSSITLAGLSMTFESLLLGQDDVLTITNSSGATLAHFKANQTAQDVLTDSPSLIIQANLSAADPQYMFVAAFATTSQECTQELTISDTLNISSPGYLAAANYSNNLNCRWIIKSPEKTTLRFHFYDLELADDFDDIWFQDGATKDAPLITTINGPWLNNYWDPQLMTSSNSLWIRFSTDNSRVAKGFLLSIVPQELGGVLRDEGSISLNGSTPPTMGADTVYFNLLVPADDQHQVLLNVSQNISLPEDALIQVYDNMENQLAPFAEFRKGDEGYPVYSNSHSMGIVVKNFFPKADGSDYMFNATFSTVLKGFYKTSIQISDSYHLASTDSSVAVNDASWTIINRFLENHIVSLKIDQYSLEAHQQLVVYNDLAESSGPLFTLTGNQSNPEHIPLIYIGNTRITYKSQPSAAETTMESDFVAHLMASFVLMPKLYHQVLNGTGAILTTPEWPGYYPINDQRQFAFPARNNSHTLLAFNSFELVENHHYIQLDICNNSDECRQVANYTGATLPLDYIWTPEVNDSLMQLTFSSVSNVLQAANGFEALYYYTECGGMMTGPGGTVQTPDFPAVTKVGVGCVFMIALPARPNVTSTSVNIIKYELELQHTKGSTDRFVIREGGNQNAILVPIKVEDGKKAAMLSRTNLLSIQYHADKGGMAFKITYSTYECPKSKQCQNAICMHDDWKCNGVDDCGDGSDEADCTVAPGKDKISLSKWALMGITTGMFILGVAAAILVPMAYRRIKARRGDEMTEGLTSDI